MMARQRKHMHWSELKKVILQNPTIKFYLIHISAKYKTIDGYFEKFLEGIPNVFIL